MADLSERRVIVRSRTAEGYEMTELGLKQLQHVFTVWFPRAVYADLTDDTVRIDVVVRKGRASGRSVYNASFVRSDGSPIKTRDYDEDRLSGTVCDSYDQTRSGYFGKKDGHDYRVICYSSKSTTFSRR
jgi:hypothetical protein